MNKKGVIPELVSQLIDSFVNAVLSRHGTSEKKLIPQAKAG